MREGENERRGRGERGEESERHTVLNDLKVCWWGAGDWRNGRNQQRRLGEAAWSAESLRKHLSAEEFTEEA